KLSPDVYALHIADDLSKVPELQERWERLVEAPTREAGVPSPRLVVISSPYRRLYGPLMDLITDLEKAHADRPIAVVIPELVERRWYHFLMHNQTAAVLKGYLFFSGLRRVVVINVPWYLAC